MPDSPSADTPITAPESVVRLLSRLRPDHPIYKQVQESGGQGFMSALMKETTPAGGESAMKEFLGIRSHPFDFTVTANFKFANGHHSTCIETKVGSTVGLGFKTEADHAAKKMKADLAARQHEIAMAPPPKPVTAAAVKKDAGVDEGVKKSKVAQALDLLVGGVNYSFQDVLISAIDDFWNTGNGYIEVVREPGGERILGLHHIESQRVFVEVEEDGRNIHYYVLATVGVGQGYLRLAKFGDLKDMRLRMKIPAESPVTEIIHFRRTTSLSRWYGFPDWLAAVAAIELVQMMHQDEFDFHLNRSCPEFMLFILGKRLPKKDWDNIEAALVGTTGIGKAHKTLALNIESQPGETTVQVEKLGLEGSRDGAAFSTKHETLSVEIVSAHRVPPLLAGIVIPGRLGANNELPNALMSFQALVVGPAQHAIETTLGMTLGNPKTNGGLGLVAEDFDLKEITEEIDLGIAATVGGMKQPAATAQAEGRNLSQGMKKSDGSDLSDEDYGTLLGEVCSEVLRRATARAQAA